MPKRTNDFQELVSLIQKALAPLGATVTDSHLVEVPGMGVPREIDVLIESAVGPYRIKIAVEAKDHGRKLDMTQFEAIVGKYFVEGGIKVNKVVIVTHNGFYEPVIARAKTLGIELMTLTEATHADWTKLPRPPSPFKTGFRIIDIEIAPLNQDIAADVILQEGQVVCSHGTRFGTPEQYAAFSFMTQVFPQNKATIIEVDADAANKPDGRKLKIGLKPSHPHFVDVRDQKLPLEELRFVVHFSSANLAPSPMAAQFSFNIAPHICAVYIEPAITEASPQDVRREGQLICTCCGKNHGTLDEWANQSIFKHLLPQRPEISEMLYDGVRRSPSGEAHLKLTYDLDQKRRVRFRGSDWPITSVTIDIHAVSATTPVLLKQYALESTQGETTTLNRLEATAAGKKFSLLIPHTDGQPPEKIVLKIESVVPVASENAEARLDDAQPPASK